MENTLYFGIVCIPIEHQYMQRYAVDYNAIPPMTAAAMTIIPPTLTDNAPAAFPVLVEVAAEEVAFPDFEIDEVAVVIETTGEEVGAGVTIESVVVVADSVESPVVLSSEEEEEEEEEEEVVWATVVVDAAILPLGPHPGM
jgi:hypothetical protein